MGHPRAGVDVADLRAHADEVLGGEDAGAPLDPVDRVLVRLAVASATTSLDLAGMRGSIEEALDLGVTSEQIAEVLTLVAALGMHTLHEGVCELRGELDDRDDRAVLDDPLDEARVQLRARYETGSSYWDRLEAQLPGFLDGLLRTAPATYAGFFEFCALAWRHGSLAPLTRELVYLAIDATPTHRYGPGFRLHLDNARRLGASARQVRAVLDEAAGAQPHDGVR